MKYAIINLKLPKLDWDNESVPVKQSSAILASLAGNIAIVVLPIMLLNRFSNLQRITLFLILALFVITLNIILITLLSKCGAVWFKKINE